MSPDDPPGQRTPDPYADTGPLEIAGTREGPPPESRWHHRRRVLREATPTWLGVLAVAFIAGLAVTTALVNSPAARHAAARAVRLVHHSPVTKGATLDGRARKLLPPAVVVRPASAVPVVSLSPLSSPSAKPKPAPTTSTPKPVRTSPKPTPTASPTVSPSPTPTPTPTPDLSPTLVTTSASTPRPPPTHPHPTRPPVTPPHTNLPPAHPTHPPTSPPVTAPPTTPAPATS